MKSVGVGYHRVAWRSTQDADTKELALRLVLTLARYGTSQCAPLTLLRCLGTSLCLLFPFYHAPRMLQMCTFLWLHNRAA
jgi:hypothetical protein